MTLNYKNFHFSDFFLNWFVTFYNKHLQFVDFDVTRFLIDDDKKYFQNNLSIHEK